MRIFVAACVVLTACAFEPGEYTDSAGGGDLGGTGSGGPGDNGPDGGMQDPLRRTCAYSSPSLRLCLDFEDQVLAPKVTDASAMRLDAESQDLVLAARGGSTAARMAYGSGIHVPEAQALDVTNALLIELWVKPTYGQPVNLVVNQSQYYLQLDGQGRVGCTLGPTSLWSEQEVSFGQWTHIACSLGDGTARVYVGGNMDRSVSNVAPLGTYGHDGTYIGTGNFVGDIDDIRVYGSALSGPDVCMHAGRSDCSSGG